MNRTGFLLILILLTAGCSEPDNANNNRLRLIITKAKELGDYHTAINATFELMSTDTNELTYYDSLATYYLKTGNFSSALNTSKYILGYKTSDHLLQVGITSAITLNKLNEVVLFAEIIVERQPKSVKWSYELAKAYFNLNRSYDAQSELLRLISIPESKIEFTSMTIANNTYEIPYYSAGQNLLGVLYANEGKLEDSEKHLIEAVRFSPEFILPAQNLALLSKE
jgi:tetratricopeptide (TPR) repeat protein